MRKRTPTEQRELAQARKARMMFTREAELWELWAYARNSQRWFRYWLRRNKRTLAGGIVTEVDRNELLSALAGKVPPKRGAR